MSPASDVLLERYRTERDPEALGALFDSTAPALFRVACALVGDPALAEDVLQETFVVVLESADRFEPGRSADAWMLGILRRQAAQARRRRARRPDPRRLPEPNAGPGPLDAAVSAEERATLLRALEDLPEPYRAVALLRWRHGLDPAEIADVRGQAPGTVWSLLSRAKRRLAGVLAALSALLVGVRAQRGLADVRAGVLRSARMARPIGVGTGGIALLGGLGMKSKIVTAAAVLVALLVCVVGMTLGRERAAPAPPTEVERLAAEGRVDRARRVAPRAASEDPSVGTADGPVDRDRDLHGEVVDDGGRPVAGAVLTALRRPWEAWRTWAAVEPAADSGRAAPGPATVSDAAGTFRLRLEPGEAVRLRVTHRDFAPRVYGDCNAGGRMRIVLSRGAALRVHVISESGGPVEGATVRVTGDVWPGRAANAESTTTDAAGWADFPGLVAGLATVDVRDAAGIAAPLLAVQVPEAGTLRRRVTLAAGRTLRGRVVDRATGAAIEGARLGFDPRADGPARSGPDGAFVVRGVRDEPGAVLTVRAAGYVTRRLGGDWSADLVVELDRGDWVTGRVVDAAGRAIGGARVVVEGVVGTGDARRPDVALSVANAEGRFAVTGVSRECLHTVVVAAAGSGRVVLDVAPAAPPGAIDLGDVVLPEPRSISGRVLDEGGTPVPELRVQLVGANDDRARRLGAADAAAGLPIVSTRATDDLGRFRFVDLAPGHYVVSVGASSAEVHVTSDDVDDVVLAAERPAEDPLEDAPLGALAVRVRDGHGDAVASAEIRVRSGSRAWIATTDDAGTARFVAVPRSPLWVTVRGPWGDDAFLDARAGPVEPVDGMLELTVRRRGDVAGRVVDGSGAPLAGQAVRATDRLSGETLLARTDDRGVFAVACSAGRSYDLDLVGNRVRSGPAGQTTFVSTPHRGVLSGVTAPSRDVVLTGALPAALRTVRLQVEDASGAPLAGATARVAGLPEASADEYGRVMLAGVPRTAIDVLVRPAPESGSRLVPRRVTLRVDADDVRVVCDVGVVMTGRVVDRLGRAVDGAEVVAAPAGLSLQLGRVRTGPDGTFRIVGVPGVLHALGARWTDETGQTHEARARDIEAGRDVPELRAE